MGVRAQPESRGFWKGLIVGLVLALVVVLGLGLVFPPIRYLPPQMPQVAPPPAPEATVPARRAAEPAPAPAAGLLPNRAPGPLIADRPVAERAAPVLSLPSAPDVFQGSPAGSPSLMPKRQP